MAVLAKNAGIAVAMGDNFLGCPFSSTGPNWPMRLTIVYGVQAVKQRMANDKMINAVRTSVCRRLLRKETVVLLNDARPSLVIINRVISLDERTMKRKMAT